MMSTKSRVIYLYMAVITTSSPCFIALHERERESGRDVGRILLAVDSFDKYARLLLLSTR